MQIRSVLPLLPSLNRVVRPRLCYKVRRAAVSLPQLLLLRLVIPIALHQRLSAAYLYLEMTCKRERLELRFELPGSFPEFEEYANSMLLASVRARRCDLVSTFLQMGTNVNTRNAGGSTCLTLACSLGHVKIVRELLKQKDLDVNGDSNGCSPLLVACMEGHWGVVCELLKHKDVDVNATCQGGHTGLIIAVAFGHVNSVCMLLRHNNVDANIKNDDGDTCLTLACRLGCFKIVREILRHDDLDVNVRDSNGCTPLLVACRERHWGIVGELLKQEKVDVTAQSYKGDTLAAIARECDCPYLLTGLLYRVGLWDIDLDQERRILRKRARLRK